MIYDQPAMDVAIDQGDLIEGCPVIRLIRNSIVAECWEWRGVLTYALGRSVGASDRETVDGIVQ